MVGSPKQRLRVAGPKPLLERGRGPQPLPSLRDEEGTEARPDVACFQPQFISDLSTETSPHEGTQPSPSEAGPDPEDSSAQGQSLLPVQSLKVHWTECFSPGGGACVCRGCIPNVPWRGSLPEVSPENTWLQARCWEETTALGPPVVGHWRGRRGCAVGVGLNKREADSEAKGAQREERGSVGSLKGREGPPEGPQRTGSHEAHGKRPSFSSGFPLSGSAAQLSLVAVPRPHPLASCLPGPDHTTLSLSIPASVKSRTDGSRLEPSLRTSRKSPGQSNKWDLGSRPDLGCGSGHIGTGTPPWNCPGEGGNAGQESSPTHMETQATVVQLWL